MHVFVLYIIYMSFADLHHWRVSGDICRNMFFNYDVEYYIYYSTVKLTVFLYKRLKFMSI
jgi:hypothetical protein